MREFDDLTMEFECPGCGFLNEIATRQFANHETIICRGCKADIELADQDGSVRKAGRTIDTSLKELEQGLKKVFEVKLKF